MEAGGFVPDREVATWLRDNFLEESGRLHNPDHQHLTWGARIGCVWTILEYDRKGRRVLGMAEQPDFRSHKWRNGRQEQQLRQWFYWLEALPDFLITFNASWARQADDAAWCALVEHELYHCGQATDEYGAPAFHPNGRPRYTIRGHDVEEFVGVVDRYGPEAASHDVTRMVQAAQSPPKVERADIASGCGTCLKAA